MHTVVEGQYLRIKVACTNDTATLSWLGKTTFTETYGAHNDQDNFQKYLKDSFSEESTRQQLEDTSSFFLLAHLDQDKTIGYAKLKENNKPFHDKTINAVELERIYVLKDYQGEGVGQNLLDKCLAFAQLRKYPVMWLGVWEKNLNAVKFYQRQGFVVFGSHKFKLGDEEQSDLLMKKDLQILEA